MRSKTFTTHRYGAAWTLALVLAWATAGARAAHDTDTIPQSVQAAMARANLPLQSLSVLVQPAGSGPALLSVAPERAMNPASIAKLVTTSAGLDLLGPAYVWHTDFLTDGVIRDGHLRGNLYVRGGGDPKLVLERIEAIYAQLQAQGIRAIDGDMVLDNRAFAPPKRAAGGFDGEALRPYNVQPDALLVNFKAVILRFVPQPHTGFATVQVEPAMAGLRVPKRVRLQSGRCGDWHQALRADFSNPRHYRLRGAYPRACGEQEWPVAYADPQAHAKRALLGLWQASGGQLRGKVRWGHVPAHATSLLRAPSLPLREVIQDINKFSNNVMAQQLFLTLSRQQPATFDGAQQTLATWWRRTLPDQPPPKVINGSGLTRQGQLSAAALAALLQHNLRAPYAEAFRQSLAIAGIDGTVKRVGHQRGEAALLGQAWLKTGTLRDVASVAGYVRNKQGQWLVVVGIINHEPARGGRAALMQLLAWAAQQPTPQARPH
jgi:D-alanyl-D-alanine carboxypeptidase/D-alanyl-D-alanine-endopeptidase (penicillin-binding protein 4)